MFASNNDQVKTFMSVRILTIPSGMAVITTGVPTLDKAFPNAEAAKGFIIHAFYQLSHRLN